MPYINKEDRKQFESIIEMIPPFVTCGELNYVLTLICQNYIKDLGGESYQIYNDIIGVLECCKQELYRRKISKYENKKIKKNGDVY